MDSADKTYCDKVSGLGNRCKKYKSHAGDCLFAEVPREYRPSYDETNDGMADGMGFAYMPPSEAEAAREVYDVEQQNRQVEALERIAEALEKLAGIKRKKTGGALFHATYQGLLAFLRTLADRPKGG